MPSPTNTTAGALRRIQRDLRELTQSPVRNVLAKPLENDLFEWRVNMVAKGGQWSGMPVHLHIRLPADYPCQPPDVRLMSPLDGHPNVFGSYICLDMLKVRGQLGLAVIDPSGPCSDVFTQLVG